MVVLADVVTTPSPHLAEIFRSYGATDVRVIENHVRDQSPALAGRRGNRAETVIGWMGGREHREDADRLPVRAVLTELLERDPQVRVVTIGGAVALGTRHPRYTHVERVHFEQLDRELAQFDIGLAPLLDTPMNRARSNVKLKEYAVVGVPWLASPVGPYLGLGERQGGCLVPDGAWTSAIEQLLRKPRELGRLTKRAQRWGQEQTISRNLAPWVSVHEDASRRASRRG